MLRTLISVRVACVSAVIAWGAVPASAEDFINQHVLPNSLQVHRIEEDWELVVGTPDPKVTAPQITTAISPLGHIDGLHAIFNLNHQALDTFAPGGMQLQLWEGEVPYLHRKLRDAEVMQSDGETVTWTQVMDLSNGGLTFDIVNGQSHTWGSFGNEGFLKSRIDTQLSNLNNYDPQASLENSGTVFAGNRVVSLTLKTVRAFTNDGSIFVIQLNSQVETSAE